MGVGSGDVEVRLGGRERGVEVEEETFRMGGGDCSRTCFSVT